MGSSSSKVARTASSTARRQYPKTPSRSTTATKSSTPTSDSSKTAAPSVNTAPPPPSPRPIVHTNVPPQSTRNEAIDLDARDPDFSSRLSRLGPVSTDPSTYADVSVLPSNRPSSTHHQSLSSSTNAPIFPSDATSSSSSSTPGTGNTMLKVVRARESAGERAETEKEDIGRRGFEGRTLIDEVTLRRAVGMRRAGMDVGAVERELRLRAGIVGKLMAEGKNEREVGVLGVAD